MFGNKDRPGGYIASTHKEQPPPGPPEEGPHCAPWLGSAPWWRWRSRGSVNGREGTAVLGWQPWRVMSAWNAVSAAGLGKPTGRVPCKSWVLEKLCALQESAVCATEAGWASYEDREPSPFPAAASLEQSL